MLHEPLTVTQTTVLQTVKTYLYLTFISPHIKKCHSCYYSHHHGIHQQLTGHFSQGNGLISEVQTLVSAFGWLDILQKLLTDHPGSGELHAYEHGEMCKNIIHNGPNLKVTLVSVNGRMD